MGDDRFVACCVIKIRNKLKYTELSRKCFFAEAAIVTGISTKWFENFQRFELWRVIFLTGVENWFEFTGVSNNRGLEKSGCKMQGKSKSKGNDNWFELSGGSRNRGFLKSGFYFISLRFHFSPHIRFFIYTLFILS